MNSTCDIVTRAWDECRASVGRRVAWIAERQYGRISAKQLVSAGLSSSSTARWVQRGRLVPVGHGVYAVGHRHASPEAAWMEATLRFDGSAGVLSHASAAAHRGFRRSAAGTVDLTVARRPRPLPGIRLHRCELSADEWTVHEGIPTTTVSRTLLDLAPFLSDAHLLRAANEAEELRLDFTPSLLVLADRHRGRRGVARLRRVAEQIAGGPIVLRSHLEAEFLDFSDESGWDRPLLNHRIRLEGVDRECDVFWPRLPLAVELDSRRHHSGWASQERDRRRDRAFQLARIPLIRVTAAMLRAEREGLRRDLDTFHRGRLGPARP